MIAKAISAYLAKIGSKGGKAKGEAKSRGGPDYYRKLAAMRKKKRGKNSQKV